MKPNHVKIAAAAAADVALATIAAVAMRQWWTPVRAALVTINTPHSVLVSGMIRFIPESRAAVHSSPRG